MNKITSLIVVALLLAFLSGCGNTIACKCMPNCMFPDAESVAAPEWVCMAEVEGYSVTAVGLAPASDAAAGISFLTVVAREDARKKLVPGVQEAVTKVLKKYFETTAADVDLEMMNKISASVVKYISIKTLTSVKTLKREVSPTGVTYVLLGLSSERFNQLAQKAVKDSVNNNAELWEKIKKEKNLDELTADILNL